MLGAFDDLLSAGPPFLGPDSKETIRLIKIETWAHGDPCVKYKGTAVNTGCKGTCNSFNGGDRDVPKNFNLLYQVCQQPIQLLQNLFCFHDSR